MPKKNFEISVKTHAEIHMTHSCDRHSPAHCVGCVKSPKGPRLGFPVIGTTPRPSLEPHDRLTLLPALCLEEGGGSPSLSLP